MSAKEPYQAKKLPTFWNFLYPFIKGGAEPESSVRTFLNTNTQSPTGKKALYVHIPFCDTICTFCPFIRSTNYHDKLQPYVDALIKELEMVAATPYIQSFELNSIYFGGGTPSVLSPKMIEDLCNTVTKNFKLAADYEWTFEVEAKSASEEKMKAMAENGVNRISFGVQTFDPYFRKIFNLTASMEEIQRTRDLGEKYFKAMNMDLLYQLPGQTLEQLQADLEKAAQLGTTSIDAYPLEYLVTSKGFLNMIKDGKLAMPPDANEKLHMQELVNRFFAENNFDQTYVYTFTRNEAPYKRFMFGETIYGRYEDEYIGCGQSAGSYLSGIAHSNHVNTEEYIKAIEAGILPVQTAYEYHAKEKGLIFFPKHMKMSLDYLYGLELDPSYYEQVDRFEALGLVVKKDGELLLTELGKKWYMNMMIEFFPADQRERYDQFVQRVEQDRQWFENTDLFVIN
ncbi:MAG: coproporphyrinogen-III oxidase family protein [Tumebacillaceae bacterium]